MGFTESQRRTLEGKLDGRNVKTREFNGRSLSFVEAWYAIAEANRIFGFDGWDRETVHSQCVWTKQLGSRFTAAYVIRMKIIVRAGDICIVREGSGAGVSSSSCRRPR